MTKIEQEIPEGWSVKRLENIVSIFKSGLGITANDISENNVYPVYGGNGLRGYTSKYTHDGNYVLIGRQGALCGNVNYVLGKNYISEHAIAFCSNESNYNKFWFFSFDNMKLNRLSESSAQPGLSVEKLGRLRLLVPPLEEQEKIAEILGCWDSGIEKLSGLIKEKETQKKGLMQKLLTPQDNWDFKRFDEIFKDWCDKNHPNEVLLSATQDRGVIPRTMLKGRVMSPEGSLSGYKLINIGDFVVSLRSFQGGLEYSEYKGILSPAYTVLKNIIDINKTFYKYFFKSYDFIEKYLAIAVIGIRDGKQISYPDLVSVKIPYPPLLEQKAIADILSKADDEIELLKNKLKQLKEQKSGLMQQLLTGKIRVKVN